MEELDILDEDLKLGRWVYPYEIPYVSPTFTERAEQRARTWRRLESDGLARDERLQPELEDLLRAWASPEILITQVAATTETDTRYRYRGGWQGQLGFLSRQDGDRMVIEGLRPEYVVPEMISFLPDWRPIPHPPVTTVTEPPKPSAEDDLPQIYDTGDDPGSPTGLRAAEHYFTAPMLRYGIITCSAREADSVARRGREVQLGTMTWFDTADGRFFTVTEQLGDGAQRQTYTPADGRRIAQWLRDRLNVALGV
ncbi:ESX secretion-associated protein EspG [Amycolatopsis suaedae]|uniref:ESX secretion-associated protein EspG n=2 Tax=Amycolatopsis suaedae TaxID=2510978 RepID=A0A4Q7J3K2_9PSEU|nr:ESX secretion-associated protein EspG [Amycolatopsis suaedae]